MALPLRAPVGLLAPAAVLLTLALPSASALSPLCAEQALLARDRALGRRTR